MTAPARFDRVAAFTFLVESVSNEKRILLSARSRSALLKLQHWPVYLMVLTRLSLHASVGHSYYRVRCLRAPHPRLIEYPSTSIHKR